MKRNRMALPRIYWVFIGILMVVLLFWVRHGKPERIGVLPDGYKWVGVHHGQALFIEIDTRKFSWKLTMRALPVNGGRIRMLTSYALKGPDLSNSDHYLAGFLSDAHLYVVVRWSDPLLTSHSSAPIVIQSPGWRAGFNMAANMLPRQPSTAIRKSKPGRPAREHLVLWCVPLGGGAVSEKRMDWIGERLDRSDLMMDISVVGNTALWVCKHRLTSRGLMPSYSLLEVPLEGGTPSIPVADLQAASAPVVAQGRVYWIEQAENGSSETYELVSARRDGSDQQSITSLPTGARPWKLMVCQNRVYALLQEPPGFFNQSSRRFVLCRMREGRSPTLETLFSLPHDLGQCYLESGSFYFAVSEVQDSLFDWSQKGLRKQNVHILYRMELPD